MGLFGLFRTSKRAKTQIEGTEKVANSEPQQNLKVWMCACGRENHNYVSTCVCGVNKRNMKCCDDSVQASACKNTTAEPQGAVVGKDISSSDTNKKIQWTSQWAKDTTEISITSNGNTVIRNYLHCRVDDDEVFKAVTMTGANILSISMTEIHDWDDREWYRGGFDSYEAYLSDEEHTKYICDWGATAEYSGISITFRKPYNRVEHGLVFCYDVKDEEYMEEFFVKFDTQCCNKITIVDKRESNVERPKTRKANESKTRKPNTTQETQSEITTTQERIVPLEACAAKQDLQMPPDENRDEYTLLSNGAVVILGRGSSPMGPYGSTQHYCLTVLENGYQVEWECGAPMAGMYGSSWELPIGFFADKNADEIFQYFLKSRGYILEEQVGILDKDMDLLIRTDQRRVRCAKDSHTEEACLNPSSQKR